MKKIVLTIAAFCFYVVGIIPVAAVNDDLTIDEQYKKAYIECSLSEINNINDEYDAYAYLLQNPDFSLENNSIVLDDSLYIDLEDYEKQELNQFVNKVNTLLAYDAITVSPSSFEIKKAPDPELEDTPMTCSQIMEVLQEARSHSVELKSVYINAVLVQPIVAAGEYFAAREKSGGIWDYKSFLGRTTTYYDPDLKATMTGETIGNFHYGYVGRTCWSASTLKSIAGIVQIYSGTSSPSYWSTYFDDPADQADIQWGINKYVAEH